jgi:hypothetical protein
MLAQASLDHSLPLYIFCVPGMTGMYDHAQLLLTEMGSHELFCLGWPQTTILPKSASQVARITGMSYHSWLANENCLK